MECNTKIKDFLKKEKRLVKLKIYQFDISKCLSEISNEQGGEMRIEDDETRYNDLMKELKNIASKNSKKAINFKYLDSVSKKTFRNIFKILFFHAKSDVKGRSDFLYHNKAFMDNFLSVIEDRKKCGILKSVLEQILYNVEKQKKYDLKIIQRIKNTIDFYQQKKDSRNYKILSKVIASQNKFSILDKNSGGEVARLILESSAKDVFEDFDFWPIPMRFATGALGKRTLNELMKNIKNEDDLKVSLDYLKYLDDRGFLNLSNKGSNEEDDDGSNDESDDGSNDAVVKGLLSLFVKNYYEPADEIKNQIEKITDDLLEDPRVNETKWYNLEKEANIIKRWKTKKSFDNFFALIKYISKTEPVHKRMWRERREFWSNYLDQNYISDAWIYLGTTANKQKSKFFDEGFNDHGTLKGGLSTHCVFIFKIRGLTIVEWSHTGKVRFWKENNKSAPPMYKKDEVPYNKFREGSDEEIVHNGSWEVKVMDYIEQETGIYLKDHK